MDLEDLLHGAVDIIFAGRLGVVGFDWESTARDREAWRVTVKG